MFLVITLVIALLAISDSSYMTKKQPLKRDNIKCLRALVLIILNNSHTNILILNLIQQSSSLSLFGKTKPKETKYSKYLAK